MDHENLKQDIKNHVKGLSQQAKTTLRSVAETARDAAASAQEVGREAVADVKGHAADAAATLRDEAVARVDSAKDTLADGGHRLADSLRNAAAEQSENSVQGRVLEAVAGGVSNVSESLRGRSLGSILSDVQNFARRHPGAFVAGAAIAGFALARFARAGSSTGGFTAHDTRERDRTGRVES